MKHNDLNIFFYIHDRTFPMENRANNIYRQDYRKLLKCITGCWWKWFSLNYAFSIFNIFLQRWRVYILGLAIWVFIHLFFSRSKVHKYAWFFLKNALLFRITIASLQFKIIFIGFMVLLQGHLLVCIISVKSYLLSSSFLLFENALQPPHASHCITWGLQK